MLRAAFEIVALAAGRISSLSLAAQSVIMTTDQSKRIYKHEFGFLSSKLITVLNTLPFGI